MLIPHSPWVFDSDGSLRTPEEAAKSSLEVQYIDQLIATNNMIRVLIDELLSSSDTPPIIILQADEGPYPARLQNDPNFDWREATEAEWKQKYGILNAYYLPNVDKAILYPSITPVNTFRLVFNLYFGTDFDLLPDNSYFSHTKDPYEFFDVTEKTTYD